MALTQTPRTVQGSASNNAGSTTSSGWQSTGYGVSGVAQITNGATGPTVGCDFVIEVADDGAGTNAREWSRQTAQTGNSVVTLFPYGLSIGGQGGDAPYYRTKFTGNTGQAVTVQAYDSTTTGI